MKTILLFTILCIFSSVGCQNEQKQEKSIKKNSEIFASIEEDLTITKSSDFLTWEKNSALLQYDTPQIIQFTASKKNHSFIFTHNSKEKSFITISFKSGNIDSFSSKLIAYNSIKHVENFQGKQKEWGYSTHLKLEAGETAIFVITSNQTGTVSVQLHN